LKTAHSSNPRANATTTAATARVQSAVSRRNGGGVPPGSYVGRMQATVAKTSRRPPGK